MSFISDYKERKKTEAGMEVIPTIKMSEIEGKPFTIRDVKCVYDMDSPFGVADTAILTVIVEGEKRILFIKQKWLFELFEEGGADADYGTVKLIKKTKKDKTFWDIVNC